MKINTEQAILALCDIYPGMTPEDARDEFTFAEERPSEDPEEVYLHARPKEYQRGLVSMQWSPLTERWSRDGHVMKRWVRKT